MTSFSRITALILMTSTIYLPTSHADTSLPDAKTLGLVNLEGDFSRQQLFNEILATDASRNNEYQSFAVKKSFKFPNDVSYDDVLKQPRKDALFGVDISHHNGKNFPVEILANNKSIFLYMKASQGSRFVDPAFAGFWQRAGETDKGVKLHRGAYHFLSSGTPGEDAAQWGRKQAATFVKIIKANGGLRPTDMPPAVDIEWDIERRNGPDRWVNRKPAEVIAMVKAFSAHVETELGRKPIIYTARSWWVPRMGGEASFAQLADHQLWLADYSNQSQASEIPRTLNNTKWAIWQFTDAAKFHTGSVPPFDASIFKGPSAGFYSVLGVKEF
ncbi:hypothetical protein FR762_18030 [Enterobacter sp. E76]|nr:hypothetical protein FR762_18030 [Enterobacter sp. E76]